MELNVMYIVSWDKVRSACISHNWYTRGNNDEYKNMLLTVCRGHTLEAIYNIAQDIYDHSDKKRIDNYFAGSEKEPVKCIMDYIINECCYMLVE